MKKSIIYPIVILLTVSCASVREARTEASAQRALRDEQTKIAVEKAVTSGSFLVKMDRLDGLRGPYVSLSPEFNYLILDKGILRLKLGYLGRQYSFRPVSAINMTAKPSGYEVKRNERTGNYEISIKVSQAGEPFNIFLFINNRGICTTHITNPKIQTARYTGRISFPEALAAR